MWAITIERTSLFKTKMTLNVYYKMYGAHLRSKQGHMTLHNPPGYIIQYSHEDGEGTWCFQHDSGAF